MGTFDSLFGNQNAKRATEAQVKGLTMGYTGAAKALNKGLAGATTQYDKALTESDPLKATYGQGVDMYANAMGLNGAAGSQAAQDAFTAGPGYQWNMDQTLQALGRAGAAAGRLDSGNTSLDFMKAAQGLSAQEYNNWLAGLQGYNGLASNVAASRAGTLQGLGDLNFAKGNSAASLAWEFGKGVGNANAEKEKANNSGLGSLIGTDIDLGTKLFAGM
ncbi:hypothetical protein [Xanthobacter pseudotagetidis]|uniref:hypothetical protein n=1 Tax=Xanthobacter pseudotagetidis TaxID=3119911 RepID=UPI00372A1DB5